MPFFIHFKITPEQRKRAKKLAPKGAYNDNSITDGERNVIGVLAELCFIDLLKTFVDVSAIDYTPTYDYDILVGTTKVDVKTKQRNYPPTNDYDASIVDYNKQKCDCYIFTSITTNKAGEYTDFYFLGYLEPEEYFKLSTFKRKGDPDGTNMIKKNNVYVPFKITKDCHQLKYHHLKQFPEECFEEALANGYDIVR